MSDTELMLDQKIERRLSGYTGQAAEDIRDLIAVLRGTEDECTRFEFEADEATRKLLSARSDALEEAAVLCEHMAESGHRGFAAQVAGAIRALIASPVHPQYQRKENK